MNNLFKSGARWILAIIIVLFAVAGGVWALPWFMAVKIIITVIFGLGGLLVLFLGLFSSGPQ